MTLGFTLTFAIFTTVATMAFGHWAQRAAERDAQERVASAASHLALEWKGRTPAEAFQEVHEDARLDEVTMLLIDRKGHVVGHDGHPDLSWPLPHQGWILRRTQTEKGTAIAGIAWGPVVQRLREEMRLLGAFAFLVSAAVGASAWFLVGRTLRPIGLLADGADAASSNPRRARLEAPSGDAEIAHLVATLNGLLSRLGEDARNREEFYASAAHELRTPLAVLSAEVEVALSRSRTVDEHEETLHDLQTQVGRLTSLVEALLTLNRIEVNTVGETLEIADPADLADSAVASLGGLIKAKRLRVETRLDAVTEVSAPPSHLAIVVRNLVENAIRYVPEGGVVEIVSEQTFRVTNDLPTGSHLDLDRIFEPFVQGDPARTSGGNGLGLAICRRIADANGWRLDLRQEQDRLVAELSFSPKPSV